MEIAECWRKIIRLDWWPRESNPFWREEKRSLYACMRWLISWLSSIEWTNEFQCTLAEKVLNDVQCLFFSYMANIWEKHQNLHDSLWRCCVVSYSLFSSWKPRIPLILNGEWVYLERRAGCSWTSLARELDNQTNETTGAPVVSLIRPFIP